MLNNIVSALAIAASLSTTYAFSPSSSSSNHNKNWRDISDLSYQNDPTTMMDQNMMVPPPPSAFQPDLDNIMETYDRAADCANNYGMCSIEELLDLSEELDEHLGCFIEDGPEACESEINDRQQLSEALLVQGEMREHQRYLEASENIAFDVPAMDAAAMDMDNLNAGGMDYSFEYDSGSGIGQSRASVWRKNDDGTSQGSSAVGSWALGP